MVKLLYSTQRIVLIPNRCLALTYYAFILGVILYIGGYGLLWSKAYQKTGNIESVVVTKVKGVIRTSQLTDSALSVPNPQFYRRVWDANDIVLPAHGGESGGFFVLTNVVITPNQTRGLCPEDQSADGAICREPKDCGNGKKLGNGFTTGKCITSDKNVNIRTCEIEAWCPVEQSRRPLGEKSALLTDTKDFTVLVKNSIEFPDFGPNYKRRNILDESERAKTEKGNYLAKCIYNPKTDPYCPTFRLGDIVQWTGDKYEEVSLTGAVFSLQINWFCSFDWGATMKDCLPKYSFSRLDNPRAEISPGFNFRSTVYHEENRRTLTQNFGLKFLIEVEGEGRKFDSMKFVLAIGASVGLFAMVMATFLCDMVFRLLCFLKGHVNWSWLSYYNEEMKFDLTHVQEAIEKKKGRGTRRSSIDLEVQESFPV